MAPGRQRPLVGRQRAGRVQTGPGPGVAAWSDPPRAMAERRPTPLAPVSLGKAVGWRGEKRIPQEGGFQVQHPGQPHSTLDSSPSTRDSSASTRGSSPSTRDSSRPSVGSEGAGTAPPAPAAQGGGAAAFTHRLCIVLSLHLPSWHSWWESWRLQGRALGLRLRV